MHVWKNDVFWGGSYFRNFEHLLVYILSNFKSKGNKNYINSKRLLQTNFKKLFNDHNHILKHSQRSERVVNTSIYRYVMPVKFLILLLNTLSSNKKEDNYNWFLNMYKEKIFFMSNEVSITEKYNPIIYDFISFYWWDMDGDKRSWLLKRQNKLYSLRNDIVDILPFKIKNFNFER